ncbi:MAG: hypothetical protein OXE84_09305, partial [Rhodobacteraceae bacterium]|nr:hypothetical protein [Paracoccaceae bacterium]
SATSERRAGMVSGFRSWRYLSHRPRRSTAVATDQQQHLPLRPVNGTDFVAAIISAASAVREVHIARHFSAKTVRST